MSSRSGQSQAPAPSMRPSLVQKLNARLAGRLLAGFMAINVLLLILGTSVLFWSAERGIRDMVRSGLPLEHGEIQDAFEIGPYRLAAPGEALDSCRFPGFLQKWLSRDAVQGVR
ncbi:MAG: hypothetical protein PHX81_12490, partial [Eubacteriales bacterium]|nr:hypothetical protein [Eubacteriales bacterium]